MCVPLLQRQKNPVPFHHYIIAMAPVKRTHRKEWNNAIDCPVLFKMTPYFFTTPYVAYGVVTYIINIY